MLSHPDAELGAGAEIELGEDVGHVSFNRGGRNEERVRDLAIGLPERDQPGHFKLSRGQRPTCSRGRASPPGRLSWITRRQDLVQAQAPAGAGWHALVEQVEGDPGSG